MNTVNSDFEVYVVVVRVVDVVLWAFNAARPITSERVYQDYFSFSVNFTKLCI